MSAAVERRAVADDDLALADRHPDRRDVRRGLAARAVVVSVLAERRVRDDQRRDELGGEHPLGLVEAAGHPAGQARPGLGDLGVAQLGAQRRVEDPGGLGPDGRPAARRRGRRASPSPRSDRSGHGGLEQGLPPVLGRELGRERRVDPVDAALEGELLRGGDGDRVLGREVVLERDGGARRPSRAASVWTSLSKSTARGATMSRVRELAGLTTSSGWLGQDVGAEDRGQDQDQDPRPRSPGAARRCA